MSEAPEQTAVDLTNCDREPIHVPGRIQPHGLLVALREPDLTVAHVSANAGAKLGRRVDPAAVIGKPLDAVLGAAHAGAVLARLGDAQLAADPLYLTTLVPSGGEPFSVLAHRFGGHVIVELEPATGQDAVTFQRLHGLVRQSVARLESAGSVVALCEVIAEEVRRVTGFGRVMIYQFDAEWHGRVVAEALDPAMHSYLHHHFPASDIPRQARELYRTNRIRLISDAAYAPADVLPAADGRGPDGRPADRLDLSYATLRSVSPIHIEYLRNMGVAASMSVSVLREGRLWGLIACHHATPRFVPFDVRAACDHLAQVASLQLSAKEFAEESEHRIGLNALQGRLLAGMAGRADFVRGLTEQADELLGLTGAGGAAVCLDGELHLVGRTPGRGDVLALVDWLAGDPDRERYETDKLPLVYPPAVAFRDVGSGLLAVAIPRYRDNFVLWFRPEVVRTITWAGNPDKPVGPVSAPAAPAGGPRPAAGGPLPESVRIHPRKSFDAWKQVVHLRSLPWRRAEVQAALGLREAIVGVVLKRAEELAKLNAELRRSNKELEAFSYSVSHDLRAPFRHIVGFSSLLKKREADRLDDTSRRYIDTIAESARYAGTLVDSLLAFSHMGRKALTYVAVDVARMVAEVSAEVVATEAPGRRIEWAVGGLPTVQADGHMLRLAVRNLLSNAVKYTRARAVAHVAVGCEDDGPEHRFFVRDDGAGFDPSYADKLFGVFQRLHRVDEFEGTGIGLANVRRIVERHGGRTWAEGAKDAGATFYFTLPKEPPRDRPGERLGGS
ncbi:MAG TPA: ATP-binding protein [Humisphaera sp.]